LWFSLNFSIPPAAALNTDTRLRGRSRFVAAKARNLTPETRLAGKKRDKLNLYGSN
jgi:hypothetical protein